MSRRLEKVPSVQLKEADGTEPMCAAKELIDKDVNRMNIEGIDPLLAKGTVTENNYHENCEMVRELNCWSDEESNSG